MSEISDLFNELLFGAGAWIGLPILIAVAFIVSSQYKHASLPFILIFVFLGFENATRIADIYGSMNVWFMLICWGVSAILGALYIKGLTSK